MHFTLLVNIEGRTVIEGKFSTLLWQSLLIGDVGCLACRITNPIKISYAQWKCAGISLQAKDTWDREAEAPKALFHLQIPSGLCSECSVFPPKPKVIQMLSFHDCGHTGKQEKNKEERCMFFFIISKIDDDFSNIGYDSATRVFACLIHMSNCSNCTCSLGNFVCKCWVGHITRHSVCSVIWFSTRGKFVNKLDVQLDAHFTCWGSDPTLRSWAGPGTMQNAI